jgi:hypothetical protein
MWAGCIPVTKSNVWLRRLLQLVSIGAKESSPSCSCASGYWTNWYWNLDNWKEQLLIQSLLIQFTKYSPHLDSFLSRMEPSSEGWNPSTNTIRGSECPWLISPFFLLVGLTWWSNTGVVVPSYSSGRRESQEGHYFSIRSSKWPTMSQIHIIIEYRFRWCTGTSYWWKSFVFLFQCQQLRLQLSQLIIEAETDGIFVRIGISGSTV